MDWLRHYWITTLTVLLGLFLAFLAIFFAIDDSNPEVSGQEEAFGVVTMGLLAVALFGGLWLLRSGRMNTWVGLGLIVVGTMGGIIWFWMIIPPIVALIVLWFGVARGGLVRELASDSG
jgi:hypothetical protein